MVQRQTHRLSAKVEFSPETEKRYLSAKNKSEFIRQAIEYFVHHVDPFKTDLEEIKLMLHVLNEKGVAASSCIPNKTDIINKNFNEHKLSDEEREKTQHMLHSFLNFGGGDSD